MITIDPNALELEWTAPKATKPGATVHCFAAFDRLSSAVCGHSREATKRKGDGPTRPLPRRKSVPGDISCRRCEEWLEKWAAEVVRVENERMARCNSTFSTPSFPGPYTCDLPAYHPMPHKDSGEGFSWTFKPDTLTTERIP